MDDALSATLRRLLQGQRLAALGTLHAGEPLLSMTPFAALADPAGFVVHVSRLAVHTRDLEADARVGMLVIAAPDPSVSPLATPRLSVQARARVLAEGSVEQRAARAAFLARFPDAEPMFGFGDFSLWLLEPVGARLVAGFGAARSLGAETLARALAEAAAATR